MNRRTGAFQAFRTVRFSRLQCLDLIFFLVQNIARDAGKNEENHILKAFKKEKGVFFPSRHKAKRPAEVPTIIRRY